MTTTFPEAWPLAMCGEPAGHHVGDDPASLVSSGVLRMCPNNLEGTVEDAARLIEGKKPLVTQGAQKSGCDSAPGDCHSERAGFGGHDFLPVDG